MTTNRHVPNNIAAFFAMANLGRLVAQMQRDRERFRPIRDAWSNDPDRTTRRGL